MAGNLKLLKKYQIPYPTALEEIEETIVIIAINQVFIGYILIADEIKTDAKQAIANLQKLNIKTVMLSGDKNAVAHIGQVRQTSTVR